MVTSLHSTQEDYYNYCRIVSSYYKCEVVANLSVGLCRPLLTTLHYFVDVVKNTLFNFIRRRRSRPYNTLMQQRWLRVCHTQADSTPLLSLMASEQRSKKLGTLLRNVKERANISSRKFGDVIRSFVSYALLESYQLLLILRNRFQEQLFDFFTIIHDTENVFPSKHFPKFVIV